MLYRGDITAGSLKVPESRAVAELLLCNADDSQWHEAIQEKNVLQTRNPATARRLLQLIRGRLELMQPPLWRLVRDGSMEVTTHAVFAAAVKHSPLLGDFLDLVVRDQYRMMAERLTNPMWEGYIEQCRERDPEMPQWSDSTVARLRSSVFQMLAQAGYLADTRTRKLQTVRIASETLTYLRDHGEDYVLRCISVSP
jgi:hypothetical protein